MEMYSYKKHHHETFLLGVLTSCPNNWLELAVFTTTPCQCLYREVSPPPGVTYLATQQYCITKVEDSRSHLLEFNGDAEAAQLINRNN